VEHTTIVDQDGARRPGVTLAVVRKCHAREIQYVELPSLAFFALSRYLEISGRLEHMKPGDPLFTSSRAKEKNTPLNNVYVNKCFKEACSQAGLDASRISLHCLRHSGARARFTSGQDIISLMRWLSHQNLSTTYRYVQELVAVGDKFAIELEKQFTFLSH
jgi:site-specific recombinase XerD